MTRTMPETTPVTEMAHGIALSSLYWDKNPALVDAAQRLRDDGYNNSRGHLSSYMAGRFLDAYMAAQAALSTRTPEAAQVETLVSAMKGIEPYLDAIICYASTMDEHEPNRLAADFRAALAQVRHPLEKEG